MTYENILVEQQNGIAIITINRPEVRNALDSQTYVEIDTAITALAQHDEIAVIILTGQGEKSFAAGADIKELRDKTFLDALQPGLQGVCKKIEDCNKVVIAAINGFALGGGCELALACDIRIAAENAKLGLPELNLAIIPGGGGTQRLSRIIGKGRALELILTGKIIHAEKAAQIGLVSEVVPAGALLEETKTYAESILSKGPLAVQLLKKVVHQGFDANLDTALLLEKLAQATLFESKDKYEGTSAFIEKRTAAFAGD